MRAVSLCALLCVLALAPAPARAGSPDQRPRDLTQISLEELMNVEVTSVSKKEQRLSWAAAAVYVITQEDIQRSGATSVPELLRLVPGLQVARIDASKCAITARGFNGRFANKLLVLIDGRSVYSPLFSGVYWDVQDTLLEDVDRIEVIRGPGATMWGANAVNGVINIITKDAAQTQGGLLSAGGGSQERGFAGLRYGGRLGSNAHYRFYSKYFNRNRLRNAPGESVPDQWDFLRGGFRMDMSLSRRDSLTLQGDLYHGREAQRLDLITLSPPFLRTFQDQYKPAGGNVLGRWEHSSGGSETALQIYYDRTLRDDALLGQVIGTFDVDFQQGKAVASRHELLWGFGYRLSHAALTNKFSFTFEPDRRRDSLFSAFLQDDIGLAEDRLRLTLGSKFEHNPFSGFEVQPTVRLAWLAHPRHTAWLAISRAVRTPSPGDQNVRINAAVWPGARGVPNLLSLFGSQDFRSENLLAYELGYRFQAAQRVALDVASFYHSYDELRSFHAGAPYLESTPAPLHVVVPGYFQNNTAARSHGLEVAASWKPSERWKWSAGYTGLALHLRRRPGDLDMTLLEGDSPAHQVNLRSYADLTPTVQFDSGFYHVGALSRLGVPAYNRLDARLGWRPRPDLELSLSFQNLLNDRHLEFAAEGASRRSEIGRSVYGKITWSFH